MCCHDFFLVISINLWNEGTYSGIRRITIIVNQRTLTTLQLDYGVEGDITVKDRDFWGIHHGGDDCTKIVYHMNYLKNLSLKLVAIMVVFGIGFILCYCEILAHFETEPLAGKIVGMHGFGSPSYVDSAGVYMREL